MKEFETASDAADDALEPKSKSQRKREMTELQDLGEELVALNPAKLHSLALPETLHDAIEQARGMAQRGARKRQLQYIGRLMREVDAAPIQRALEAVRQPQRQATLQFHQVERWRERLLAQGDAALQEFSNAYPGADRQHLRGLLRNAEAEAAAHKAPRAARLLFQYVREVLEAHQEISPP